MFSKTIIIFLFSFCAFGQQIKKPYPYRGQAEIWIKNFKNLQTDSERFSEIKKKIYSDTLYFNYKKIIILDGPRDPEKYICKTLFYLKNNNDYIGLDLLENPKLLDFIENLKLKKIKSIKLLEDPENIIYFGEEGLCGVIFLECDKKLMKLLKKKSSNFSNQ